jgi:cysteine sulfinate desulfinase/cysteine desulfurase-like protein
MRAHSCPGLRTATALAHPQQIYLREDLITAQINRCIGTLFDPVHRRQTVQALLAADDSAERLREHTERLRDRVAAAETVMKKLRNALDSGWDPVELREQYNAAVAEKRATESWLAAASNERGISRAELEAYVDQLGDMATALISAEPQERSELHASLRFSLTYHNTEQIIDVEVDPIGDRVDKLRVRGGTRTLTTRLDLIA